MKQTDDLERHLERLGACRRCGHPEPVIPILSRARRARAMLVGQAPGKVEISSQKPFAGRAGKTLFRWLAEAGLSEDEARERIYIAAMTRCFPGAHPSGRGDRVPTRVELERCGSWLDDELMLIRPKLLIPVGKLAIGRFLGDAPLADVVGREHTVEHVGGESVVVPLPHPSGASSWIHAPGHRELVSKALRLIGKRMRTLVAAAAVLVALAPRAAAAQIPADDWFGTDKVKHFFTSALIQSLAYSVTQVTTRGPRSSLLLSASVATAAAGIGKEMYDRRSYGHFSVRDLAWDAAGAGTASLMLARTRD
ncbi:MAG: uracil-DNA glycosylase family protein [Gemmatimonadaceae bacterium]